MNKHGKTAFVCLLLFASASNLFAQTPSSYYNNKAASEDSSCCARPNIIKTNLAGPLSILYEARVYPRRSIQVSMNRINFGLLGDEDSYFGLTGAVKFYLSKRAGTTRRPLPTGFYVSPYLRYLNVHSRNYGLFSNMKLAEVNHNLFGGGVTAGYQLIFRKGFTLDFFAGGGYLPVSSSNLIYSYSNTYQADVNSNDYKVDPRLGICFGYAF